MGIWRGLPPRTGRYYIDKPPPRNFSADYNVDVDLAVTELVWANGKTAIPASKMAETLMRLLLEHAHNNAVKDKR